MSGSKKVISPISCEKEPMSTVYDNIAEYAKLKDIPFALAVRKFLFVGNAALKRRLVTGRIKNEKNKP